MRNKTPFDTTRIPEAGRLLTEIELAERLQASRRTVVTWREQGRFPYIRLGRLIRYDLGDVLNHLRKVAPKHGGIR